MRNRSRRSICLFLIFLHICKECQARDSGALTIRISESDSTESDSTNDENKEDTNNIFVATSNWKEIQPGQQIPAGLHVRLNLQTGKKEAKLIDTNEENMHESLKKISNDVMNSELLHQAENEFKSIDNIKKKFAELKLNVKTDYEILKDLTSRLKAGNASDTSKLEIFADLEYLLHQYDNAQDFVKLDGLNLIIPALNSSNEDVRSSAVFLLGSALQSNPKVQIAALESMLLMTFIRLIIWDPSIAVRNHAMFALSCLTRQFPLAQQHLIDQGGFAALAEMFQHNQHVGEFNKLLLKSVTLIYDLMQEQKLVMDSTKTDQKMTEDKLEQYKRVKLAQAVNEQDWCRLIPRQLHSPDHDDREKILQCMLILIDNCHVEFKIYQPQLSKLKSEYRTLADAETDETTYYFTDLYLLTETLLQYLSNFTIKDEL